MSGGSGGSAGSTGQGGTGGTSSGGAGSGSGGAAGNGGGGGAIPECAPVYPNRCEIGCRDAHTMAASSTCIFEFTAFNDSVPDQEGFGNCLLDCDMDPDDQICIGPADMEHGCCQMACFASLPMQSQELARIANDC